LNYQKNTLKPESAGLVGMKILLCVNSTVVLLPTTLVEKGQVNHNLGNASM
jgi:hypothetical protein